MRCLPQPNRLKLTLAAIVLGSCLACSQRAFQSGIDPVAVDDFAARLATAYCGRVITCCRPLKLDDLTYDGCVARLTNATKQTLADLDADYDPVAAAACITAHQDLYPGCKLAGVDRLRRVCSRAFTGHRAAGATCTSDVECAPRDGQHTRCVAAEDASDGGVPAKAKCARAPLTVDNYDPVARGAGCVASCYRAGERTQCEGDATSTRVPKACEQADGLFCATDGTCARTRSDGAGCTHDGMCAQDSYCERSDASADDGQCQPKRTPGEPCERAEQCDSGQCGADGCVEVAVPAICASPLSDWSHPLWRAQ